MTELFFIRHGKTQGNLEKRYVGRTDEPLCKAGIVELKRQSAKKELPQADLLIASPMKRCVETAHILYPQAPVQIILDFCEIDFGDFEYQDYSTLFTRTDYRRFLDSGGNAPIPNGESRAEFSCRVCTAFASIVPEILQYHTVVFVVHGGTIMALMECFAVPKRGYYDTQVGNGAWVHALLDAGQWAQGRTITADI